MAVATSVASLEDNPSCSAIALPSRRAITRSMSDDIGTRISFSRSKDTLVLPGLLVQVREALLEIKGGGNVLQREPELHHRERDFGLNSHDDGLRAAQPDHVGKVAQSPRGERIEDINGGNVDDHSAREKFAHPIHQ